MYTSRPSEISCTIGICIALWHRKINKVNAWSFVELYVSTIHSFPVSPRDFICFAFGNRFYSAVSVNHDFFTICVWVTNSASQKNSDRQYFQWQLLCVHLHIDTKALCKINNSEVFDILKLIFKFSVLLRF